MSQVPTQPPPPFDPATSRRTTAGILAILLGGWGAHRFYIGDTTGGILRIVACCGAFNIIGIVEGIMYLRMTDEQFYKTYIVEKKAWF